MNGKGTYVLLHRLELEDNANQTENVDPYLFEDLDDAVEKAVSIMRDETARWGWGSGTIKEEAELIRKDLKNLESGCNPDELHSSYLVQLTDSDNEVFELYRRTVKRKARR